MLEHFPKPSPDVERFKTVLRRGAPDRVPLVELAIADEVLAAVSSGPLTPAPADVTDRAALRGWAADRVRLWHALGYDYYRARVEIPFAVSRIGARDTAELASGDRQWVNEHAGAIASWEHFKRYPWPAAADVNFAPAEAAIDLLPDGMGAIGFSGGVLEWASTIMGLERFMIALHRQPDLVTAVVDRVGRIIEDAFRVFCQMDRVFAIWLGDDMGFKTATLIRPEHLRRYILPWHRRYAELAHASGRFFMLHSCGHVEAVMPDLIGLGLDGKHSFEDAITPVEQFKRAWGERVAVLGGIDMDLLARATPEQVRARTRQVLEACAPTGGYACGSGNSIANYVLPANYLAMLETVHAFNGGTH